MGVAGGALFPTLMALTKDNRDVHLAFVIPLCGFVVQFLYAVFGSKWIVYVDEDEKDKEVNSADIDKAVDKTSIAYPDDTK